MICRLLQYIETPSYLRRSLFPFHNDFKSAGLLPLLDMPHHMRKNDDSWFREGVTLEKLSKSGTSLADIGLQEPISIDKRISPNIRITVQLNDNKSGIVVSPTLPQKYGLYWGFQTRLANSFGEVFTNSIYEDLESKEEGDGISRVYDCIIGHSDSGSEILDKLNETLEIEQTAQHILIVFGGTDGIEACIEADESFPIPSKDAHSIFHHWLNLCPSQGCRVVRTEECIAAGLAKLNPYIRKVTK